MSHRHGQEPAGAGTPPAPQSADAPRPCPHRRSPGQRPLIPNGLCIRAALTHPNHVPTLPVDPGRGSMAAGIGVSIGGPADERNPGNHVLDQAVEAHRCWPAGRRSRGHRYRIVFAVRPRRPARSGAGGESRRNRIPGPAGSRNGRASYVRRTSCESAESGHLRAGARPLAGDRGSPSEGASKSWPIRKNCITKKLSAPTRLTSTGTTWTS